MVPRAVRLGLVERERAGERRRVRARQDGQAGQPSGVVGGREPGDLTAPVVPDEMGPVDLQRIEHVEDVGHQPTRAVRLDLDRPHARAVAALVDRHGAVAGVGQHRQTSNATCARDCGKPWSSSTVGPSSGPAASAVNVPSDVTMSIHPSSPTTTFPDRPGLTGRPRRRRRPQHAVRRGQRSQRLVGVQPARVGQHPQLGAGQVVRLAADLRGRQGERLAIRSEAEHGDHLRPHPFDEPGERAAPERSCARGELVGARRGERHDVADAHAGGEELVAIGLGHARAGVDDVPR